MTAEIAQSTKTGTSDSLPQMAQNFRRWGCGGLGERLKLFNLRGPCHCPPLDLRKREEGMAYQQALYGSLGWGYSTSRFPSGFLAPARSALDGPSLVRIPFVAAPATQVPGPLPRRNMGNGNSALIRLRHLLHWKYKERDPPHP